MKCWTHQGNSMRVARNKSRVSQEMTSVSDRKARLRSYDHSELTEPPHRRSPTVSTAVDDQGRSREDG